MRTPIHDYHDATSGHDWRGGVEGMNGTRAWNVPIVYHASYAWRFSDPLGFNVGFDRQAVEQSIYDDMDERMEHAHENCNCENCEDCELCDHDDLVWYGTSPESLLATLRNLDKFARQDLMDALRNGDVARLPAY